MEDTIVKDDQNSKPGSSSSEESSSTEQKPKPKNSLRAARKEKMLTPPRFKFNANARPQVTPEHFHSVDPKDENVEASQQTTLPASNEKQHEETPRDLVIKKEAQEPSNKKIEIKQATEEEETFDFDSDEVIVKDVPETKPPVPKRQPTVAGSLSEKPVTTNEGGKQSESLHETMQLSRMKQGLPPIAPPMESDPSLPPSDLAILNSPTKQGLFGDDRSATQRFVETRTVLEHDIEMLHVLIQTTARINILKLQSIKQRQWRSKQERPTLEVHQTPTTVAFISKRTNHDSLDPLPIVGSIPSQKFADLTHEFKMGGYVENVS
jgi:hypothetical protein